MPGTCSPDARDAVRSAARALEDMPVVVEAQTLAPAEGRRVGWTVWALLERGTPGVPPAISSELVGRDLTVTDRQQGPYREIVAFR